MTNPLITSGKFNFQRNPKKVLPLSGVLTRRDGIPPEKMYTRQKNPLIESQNFSRNFLQNGKMIPQNP
jgi:hypothetical protein